VSDVVGPRRARADTPRRRKAIISLTVVGVLLLAAAVADAVVPPAPEPPAERIAQDPASAGTWFCPSVTKEGGAAALHIAAVGDQPAQVVVERYASGEAVPDKPRTVEPGTEVVVRLTGKDATAPSTVRWAGGPTAAVWRMFGEDERGAAAPCERAPAPTWYLTGFSTELGSEPLVHVFNPYTTDAVVRLDFGTPDGLETLSIADNILIGAGRTRTLNLRRFKPEESDLGVTVVVLSGRVVAQGELNIVPPPRITSAAGRTLLPATPEPSEEWYFATASDDKSTDSWLSVLNPGDDAAAVELRVTTPRGRGSSLLTEISVPPGAVARIELANASSSSDFGVSLAVVNSEPVVASRMTSRPGADGSILTGGLGAPAASPTWALLGAGSSRLVGTISLFNAGAEATLIDVRTPGAPATWSGIRLGPNRRTTLSLADVRGGEAYLPVVVQAQAPIAAALRGANANNAFEGWQMMGVPDTAWIGSTTRPQVRHAPLLSTQLHTAAPPTEDPLAGLGDVEAPAASEGPGGG
jgi:hypothetical protein